MKQSLIAVVLIVSAASAAAQNQIQTITTSRTAGSGTSGFSIGPRLSNYSTDIDGGLATIKTGRQSSFGLVGDYRNGPFVLDFNYDHDPENGIRITDLILDIGDYSRDKGEVTAGYAIAPVLDLQAGVRFDTIRVGGTSIFGNNFGTDLNIDHSAIGAGIRFHTGDDEQVGFYALGRGYIGSAKFDLEGLNVNSDATGFRGEAGVKIRVGDSNWSVVPGAEFERIETKDYDIRLNTNRFFLNFVFRTRM